MAERMARNERTRDVPVLPVTFVTHYASLYGANRSLVNLLEGLREHDVLPHVLVPRVSDAADGLDVTHALRSRGIEVTPGPVVWWLSRRPQRVLGQSSREYAAALVRWRRERLNCWAQSLRELPGFVRRFERSALIYSNSAFTQTGAIVAALLRRPHVWHLREFCDDDYGYTFDLGKRLSHRVIRRAEGRVAISEAIRNHYSDAAGAAPIALIRNGIASKPEFERLRRRAEQEPSGADASRPYVFAMVGLVRPSTKGQDVAIRAFALLARDMPQVRLLIAGNGDTTAVRSLAASLGVGEKVDFWGHISDPYRAYFASDATLMCSRREGLGRVTIEAMSACRPVIGFDSAGTHELIVEEQTGLLYRQGAEELANCMKRLVSNRAWARQLGVNGWHVAREKYSTELCARQVHEVLRSVASRSMGAGFPRAWWRGALPARIRAPSASR